MSASAGAVKVSNEWYENGQLWSEMREKDGKQHGECKKWWMNGVTRAITCYQDGCRQDHKEWYMSGQQKVITRYYQDGRKQDHKEFYKNGQLSIHEFYEHLSDEETTSPEQKEAQEEEEQETQDDEVTTSMTTGTRELRKRLSNKTLDETVFAESKWMEE